MTETVPLETSRLDVWSTLLRIGDEDWVVDAVRDLERLGYHTVWLPGREAGPGPDVFAVSRLILQSTSRLNVATGILNIWALDAAYVARAAATLLTDFPGRFLLGLGVSHAPTVEGLGFDYSHPLGAMRDYLDALDASETPVPQPDRLLAALRPGMLRLSRDRTAGAHPYLTMPEHTAAARVELGPSPLLVPEQGVVLMDDPGEGRAVARTFFTRYQSLPNYTENLQRFGFTADDVLGEASDRLIDRLFRHGSPAEVVSGLEEHLTAGADRVAVQVLGTDPQEAQRSWRAIAAELH